MTRGLLQLPRVIIPLKFSSELNSSANAWQLYFYNGINGFLKIYAI